MNETGHDYSYVETPEQFIEAAFEIAFGENAINRDFDFNSVLCELHKFSDEALELSEGMWQLYYRPLYVYMGWIFFYNKLN